MAGGYLKLSWPAEAEIGRYRAKMTPPTMEPIDHDHDRSMSDDIVATVLSTCCS